jgi:hypothetical protein
MNWKETSRVIKRNHWGLGHFLCLGRHEDMMNITVKLDLNLLLWALDSLVCIGNSVWVDKLAWLLHFETKDLFETQRGAAWLSPASWWARLKLRGEACRPYHKELASWSSQ